eukprot:SAG31_NODE_13_length_37961_cov_21.751307_21_plen_732_part_00
MHTDAPPSLEELRRRRLARFDQMHGVASTSPPAHGGETAAAEIGTSLAAAEQRAPCDSSTAETVRNEHSSISALPAAGDSSPEAQSVAPNRDGAASASSRAESAAGEKVLPEQLRVLRSRRRSASERVSPLKQTIPGAEPMEGTVDSAASVLLRGAVPARVEGESGERAERVTRTDMRGSMELREWLQSSGGRRPRPTAAELGLTASERIRRRTSEHVARLARARAQADARRVSEREVAAQREQAASQHAVAAAGFEGGLAEVLQSGAVASQNSPLRYRHQSNEYENAAELSTDTASSPGLAPNSDHGRARRRLAHATAEELGFSGGLEEVLQHPTPVQLPSYSIWRQNMENENNQSENAGTSSVHVGQRGSHRGHGSSGRVGLGNSSGAISNPASNFHSPELLGFPGDLVATLASPNATSPSPEPAQEVAELAPTHYPGHAAMDRVSTATAAQEDCWAGADLAAVLSSRHAVRTARHSQQSVNIVRGAGRSGNAAAAHAAEWAGSGVDGIGPPQAAATSRSGIARYGHGVRAALPQQRRRSGQHRFAAPRAEDRTSSNGSNVSPSAAQLIERRRLRPNPDDRVGAVAGEALADYLDDAELTYERLVQLDEDGERRDGLAFRVVRRYHRARFAALKRAAASRCQHKHTTKESCLDLPTECPICLEEYAAADWIKMLPCQHKFHEDCILRWFKDHHICPMCRFDCRAHDEAQGHVQQKENGPSWTYDAGPGP